MLSCHRYLFTCLMQQLSVRRVVLSQVLVYLFDAAVRCEPCCLATGTCLPVWCSSWMWALLSCHSTCLPVWCSSWVWAVLSCHKYLFTCLMQQLSVSHVVLLQVRLVAILRASCGHLVPLHAGRGQRAGAVCEEWPALARECWWLGLKGTLVQICQCC